ncbi:hypothetical protein ABFX02_08G064000 [Erythranthe guttata]
MILVDNYYPMTTKGKKRPNGSGGERFLISVNVIGSAGPIRFVVSKNDKADSVIETVLKKYGREGRLPILGSNFTSFFLYPANAAGFYALKGTEAIGSRGLRNFVLCKINNSNNNSVLKIGRGGRLIGRLGRGGPKPLRFSCKGLKNRFFACEAVLGGLSRSEAV